MSAANETFDQSPRTLTVEDLVWHVDCVVGSDGMSSFKLPSCGGNRTMKRDLSGRWDFHWLNRWAIGLVGGIGSRRRLRRATRPHTSHGVVSAMVLEQLEGRVLLTASLFSSVVANDDFISIDSNTSVAVDVLANDLDSEGTLDASTFSVSAEPVHGSAYVELTEQGRPAIVYTPELNFKGTDVFTYSVQETGGGITHEAAVTVSVLNQPPFASDTFAATSEDAPVDIDVLSNVFDPDGVLNSASLTMTSPPARGTVAFLEMNGSRLARYTPDPRLAQAVLVVDDPKDVNDGNYSKGHLSLREAILLANADPGSDSFTYTLRDNDGGISNAATVAIDLAPARTTITFAPSLKGRRLLLTQVSDASAGNTALAITSTITIEAPTKGGLTLVGPGSREDLRLFRVFAGGELTLQNLTMTNWHTDSNGGVLAVDPQGIASLTSCTLSNNSALSQGGAIFSYGRVMLADCTLSGNHAHDGGALAAIYRGSATFSNCLLKGNTAVDRGGATVDYNGKVTMTYSRLVGNSANQGGAMAGGYMVLGHSSLTGNRAADGGAIFVGIAGGAADYLYEQVGAPGDPSLVDLGSCTIAGNSAQHRGGGLYVRGGGFYSSNNTFIANRAQQGGGVFLDSSSLGFLTKNLPQGLPGTVFAGNAATATGGGIFINNGELSVDG